MTAKSKKEIRDTLLISLQNWHKNLGILDFPKRYGISTNEKKFREISFRVKKGIEEEVATYKDVVANFQPIYGLGNAVVGYVITYRVWLPTAEGKLAGKWTIRFSLHMGVVGLVKIGDFFMVVEHDYFPLQRKCIGLPRMFGVTPEIDLNTLANLLLLKEYPFIMDNIESLSVKQLGDIVYQDPSTRADKTLNLLIDIKLKSPVTTKEDLALYIDPKNQELLLHHIFSGEELYDLYKNVVRVRTEKEVFDDHRKIFIDQFSLWVLGVYFSSK